jgi:hypothetical protein
VIAAESNVVNPCRIAVQELEFQVSEPSIGSQMVDRENRDRGMSDLDVGKVAQGRIVGVFVREHHLVAVH